MIHIVSKSFIQEELPVNNVELDLLDVEWVDLISNAREIGLSVNDIRAFLASPTQAAHHIYVNTEINGQYVLK